MNLLTDYSQNTQETNSKRALKICSVKIKVKVMSLLQNIQSIYTIHLTIFFSNNESDLRKNLS